MIAPPTTQICSRVMMASPRNSGGPGNRIRQRHHLGVLDKPIKLRKPDADEDGRGDHGEAVGLPDRPQDRELEHGGEQAGGERREQIGRPVAEPEHLDDAIGCPGAGEHEGAMREIHRARRLVDDDDADGGKRVDGPELEATHDDHQEFSSHRRNSAPPMSPDDLPLPVDDTRGRDLAVALVIGRCHAFPGRSRHSRPCRTASHP